MTTYCTDYAQTDKRFCVFETIRYLAIINLLLIVVLIKKKMALWTEKQQKQQAEVVSLIINCY